MLIDWFTVCAQMVNFLILVWLLKRFLYKPILNAIDTREKAVAAQFAQAAAKEAAARTLQDDLQHKTSAFDQDRTALLTKATDDAKTEHQRLLDEAHKEFDTLRAQQKEALDRERNSVSAHIVDRTFQEVFAITRKTLSDLASTSLEQCMTDVFVGRLRAMKAEDKSHLVDTLKESSQIALVRSAFDLPADQRAAIEAAINETLAMKADVRFETAPGLASGIELSTQGYKLSWSITNYLDSLEKSMSETLKAGHAS